MSIVDRASNVLARLLAEPSLQNGELSFVAYSYGGLITKEILRTAQRNAPQDSLTAGFLRRIRRICFLGTPHQGADLASRTKWLSIIIRPSPSTNDLVRNNPNLRGLNNWYRHFAADNGIQSLSLVETRSSGLLGQIVKPDSADPGLLSDPIPVDSDHDSIRSPRDQHSEVYIYIRDFLKRPVANAHRDSLIADSIGVQTSSIEKLAGAQTRQLETIDSKLDRLIASEPNFQTPLLSFGSAIIDAELDKRLWAIRKSRFFLGYPTLEQTQQLYHSIIGGELASASSHTKMKALAWCARLTAAATEEVIFEPAISAARQLGDCEEIKLAEALRISLHDRPEALAQLNKINSHASRSVSFFITAKAESPSDALIWLTKCAFSLSDLDSDGKFFVIQKLFEAGRWSEALTAVGTLDDSDFTQTPVLLIMAANAHLVQVVPEELRATLVEQLPSETSSFPLASDRQAMENRLASLSFYERAAAIASMLDCDRAAQSTSDRVLWLKLRNPNTSHEARVELAQSMRDPSYSLRRTPMALEFGLKLDLVAVENEIEQQTTLSGGKSIDAALARFALAFRYTST
jgi:hypothetical protein